MAITTCADCSAEVTSADVRYVNGRQVCTSCAGGDLGAETAPLHGWPRVLAAAAVASVVVAVASPLVMRAMGVSSMLVLGAGGALIGLAVRMAARNHTSAADRMVAVAFALFAAAVGDYLLFALDAPGGFAAAGNVDAWIDALTALGPVSLAMRFALGPALAFFLSAPRE